MSYYIKPTYPELDINKPSKTFHSWLGNYKVEDNYGNWTFSGDYYIFANAYLPNYAFYLDFQTFFASIKNINLIWTKTIVDKKLPNNNSAYSINQYAFSFDVPTINSSYFKDYIIDKNINFRLNPSFNQKIMNDFKIEVEQKNLNSWINDINKTTNYGDFQYSNYFDLNKSVNKLDFSLANDSIANLEINIDNFMSQNKPINNLMLITKFSDHSLLINNLVIKIKYKIENQPIKELNLKISDSISNERKFILSLNKNFNFDNNELNLQESINGFHGIYFPIKTIGSIDVLMDIEYMSKIRTLHFERQFSFDENIEKMCEENIAISSDKIEQVFKSEVQSENIF